MTPMTFLTFCCRSTGCIAVWMNLFIQFSGKILSSTPTSSSRQHFYTSLPAPSTKTSWFGCGDRSRPVGTISRSSDQSSWQRSLWGRKELVTMATEASQMHWAPQIRKTLQSCANSSHVPVPGKNHSMRGSRFFSALINDSVIESKNIRSVLRRSVSLYSTNSKMDLLCLMCRRDGIMSS